MKFFLTRYLFPYLKMMAVLAILLIIVVAALDGWPVLVGSVVFALFALGMIPYWINEDYQMAKRYVMTARAAYLKGELTKDDYLNVAMRFASDIGGVPDFVCEWAKKYAVKKLANL